MSELINEKYRNTFTKESIKRAEGYGEVFQYGCHFLSDEDIVDLMYQMADKMQKSIDKHLKGIFKLVEK